MERKEFEKLMTQAIRIQRRGGAWHHNYSCGAIWDAFGYDIKGGCRVHRDYEKLFKLTSSAYWMNDYYYSPRHLQQERIGMLEMFKQVALDGEFYERYH